MEDTYNGTQRTHGAPNTRGIWQEAFATNNDDLEDNGDKDDYEEGEDPINRSNTSSPAHGLVSSSTSEYDTQEGTGTLQQDTSESSGDETSNIPAQFEAAMIYIQWTYDLADMVARTRQHVRDRSRRRGG